MKTLLFYQISSAIVAVIAFIFDSDIVAQIWLAAAVIIGTIIAGVGVVLGAILRLTDLLRDAIEATHGR